MIKEFEFYHGVIFSRFLHNCAEELCVKSFPSPDNASYVLNDKVGIYVKYSTKRLSPWRFSFQQRHQDEILKIMNQVGEVFVLLVCKDDGIATLSFDELKRILNETHDSVEWISVTRNRRQMYSIKGSDGKLEFKIGQNEFPMKLIKAINTPVTANLAPTSC